MAQNRDICPMRAKATEPYGRRSPSLVRSNHQDTAAGGANREDTSHLPRSGAAKFSQGAVPRWLACRSENTPVRECQLFCPLVAPRSCLAKSRYCRWLICRRHSGGRPAFPAPSRILLGHNTAGGRVSRRSEGYTAVPRKASAAVDHDDTTFGTCTTTLTNNGAASHEKGAPTENDRFILVSRGFHKFLRKRLCLGSELRRAHLLGRS